MLVLVANNKCREFSGNFSDEVLILKRNFDKYIKMYSCTDCSKVFTKSYSLKRHMSNIHNVQYRISRRSTQCPYPSCEEKFPYFPPMKQHLSAHHGITLTDEIINFASMKDFHDWKKIEETNSNVKYIKACGVQRLQDETEVNRFNCNRTGIYTPEGKGLRRLKTTGSCKIGASCPSTLTANRHPNGTVTVSFCQTHVGHDQPLKGLPVATNDASADSDPYVVSEEARRVLTNFGIPADEQAALAEVAFRFGDVPIERTMDAIYKLADPKMTEACEKVSAELRDILDSPCLQNRDTSASNLFSAAGEELEWEVAESGVGECPAEENPIVLYQTQAEGETEMVADDVIIIVMNTLQAHLLRKFGHLGTVYLDAIHGVDASDRSVLGLFVLDNLGRSFLCALCMCRQVGPDTLLLFFNKILSRAGRVTPKVFMSDGIDWVQEMWTSVMGACDQWLHTLWHTDITWRRHLQLCLTAESDRPACAAIYWHLCRLLKSDSKLKFCQLRSFLLSYMSAGRYGTINSPAAYFTKVLCQKLDNWAWYFRSATLRNLAVQLEAVHGAISSLCQYPDDGLGPVLFALCQYYRRQSFVYMSDATLRSTSLQLTAEHHRRSEQLLAQSNGVTLSQLGEEPVWIVEREGVEQESATGHLVQKSGATCPGNCFARCRNCSACVHEFECSCVQSAILWRLCQHIHFVGCHRHEVLDCQAAEEEEEEGVFIKGEGGDGTEEQVTSTLPPVENLLEEISRLGESICEGARQLIDRKRLIEIRDALSGVVSLLEKSTNTNDAVISDSCQMLEDDEGDRGGTTDHDYYVSGSGGIT